MGIENVVEFNQLNLKGQICAGNELLARPFVSQRLLILM
jgi:hypothetical protein